MDLAPYASGVLLVAGTLEPFPYAAELVGSNQPHGCNFEFLQTHIYYQGEYVDIPDQALLAGSWSWPAMERNFDLATAYIAYATTDTKRYGTFEFRLTARVDDAVNGPVWTRSFNLTTSPTSGGGPGMGGGGITPTDLENQPINQPTFWQNLWGPSQEEYDAFEASAIAFSQWGPIAIYTDVLDLFGALQEPDYTEMYMGFGTYDLSAFTDVFRVVRVILAGSFWVTAIFFLWRKFLAKV